MIALRVDRGALLDQAYRRATTRGELARSLALRPAQDELRDCLASGWRCVQELARPQAWMRRVPAALVGEAAGDGAQHWLYLLSTGHDARDALRRLGGDYAAYHCQHLIACELLYALGRQVLPRLARRQPVFTWRRLVLRGAHDGRDPAWDPGRVSAALRAFDGVRSGVRSTNGGALAPLHSLLGLAVGSPLPPTPKGTA